MQSGIIHGRFPEAGKAKTRLIRQLVLKVHLKFTRFLTERTVKTLKSSGYKIEIHYTEE